MSEYPRRRIPGISTAAIRSTIWLPALLVLVALGTVHVHRAGANTGIDPTPAIEESLTNADIEQAASGFQGQTQRFRRAVERGPFWMYLLAFLAGIATSLTPCVLPIIPLTIAVIGAKSVESRIKGFLLSLVYVLGIAITYSTLGVVSATSGGLLGSQFQSKPFLIFFVLIFTLLAFGLFGAYQLQLPAPIRNRLMAKQGEGWFGVLFMGLIAGLVASPCAGPIVAGILVIIADTGNIVLGFTLMFTFSMGLGLLFLIVGTFAGEIKKLPTGPWMTAVENGLGIALLVVAFYYLSFVLDTFSFVLILGAALVAGGSFTGAFIRLSAEDAGWFTKAKKALGIMLVAAGLYFFVGGLITFGIFLPPMGAIGWEPAAKPQTGQSTEGVTSESVGVVWKDDLEAALFVAEMDRKPVMIDFTADWCVACKELDHFTFSDRAVVEEFKKFILVRIDLTDEADPQNEEYRRRYSILTLPSVTFLTPAGDILPDYTLNGFVRAPEFLEILVGVLEASKNQQ